MKFEWIRSDKKRYMDLLLLADEQESMIDRYLERGEMFVLQADDGESVCVAVVTDEGGGICELKNIAVVPTFQGRGYGCMMVEYLCRRYGDNFVSMTVGTGESTKTVSFYKKCGFVYSHSVPDFSRFITTIRLWRMGVFCAICSIFAKGSLVQLLSVKSSGQMSV